MFGLIGWLTASRRAKADALHLRERYGDRAEAWCAGALRDLPASDARRKSIQRIAKALQAMSDREAARPVRHFRPLAPQANDLFRIKPGR
jgi:hypothetical protein